MTNSSDGKSAREAFLKHLSEGRRARRADIWKIGIYKKLLDTYGLPRNYLDVYSDDTEQDPEDLLRDSFEESDEISKIFPKKVKVIISDFISKPLDNPAFNALCSIKEFDPFRRGGGIIVPVEYYGDWILHTLGHPDGTLSGKAYIIIYANRNCDQDLMAEPLEQFLDSRKRNTNG